mmetsp:Transcript_1061/g.1518  ORF Transcript_1061/g.1518 Transcript_1061/m.1518 type:complete len:116 (+) Transcript_1061:463-810(+)
METNQLNSATTVERKGIFLAIAPTRLRKAHNRDDVPTKGVQSATTAVILVIFQRNAQMAMQDQDAITALNTVTSLVIVQTELKVKNVWKRLNRDFVLGKNIPRIMLPTVSLEVEG